MQSEILRTHSQASKKRTHAARRPTARMHQVQSHERRLAAALRYRVLYMRASCGQSTLRLPHARATRALARGRRALAWLARSCASASVLARPASRCAPLVVLPSRDLLRGRVGLASGALTGLEGSGAVPVGSRMRHADELQLGPMPAAVVDEHAYGSARQHRGWPRAQPLGTWQMGGRGGTWRWVR